MAVCRRVPADAARFCEFLQGVAAYVSPGGKIYVHCRGGHGRAGLAVAALLILRSGYEVSPHLALSTVYDAHQERPTMQPRWRKKGSPQTVKQKQFVRRVVREK